MRNYLYYKEKLSYPKDKYFRPNCLYPEYPFRNTGLSKTPNDVYDSIRDMFIRMKLDERHIGSSDWNPLSDYIALDNIVLIKPNWVKHKNEAVKGKQGLECLITHSSIVKCIIDYVLIALQGTGKIIVADAPMQSCDFNELQKKCGIYEMKEFYKRENVQIEFVDLRNYRSCKKGTHIMAISAISKYKGTIVNMGKYSYFYKNSRNGKLRITNYNFHDVNRHHKGSVQEYYISDICLNANVIINLPKPKTHRKAGYTGALKNMIGVNALKEYLPHHTKGAYISGIGDEYFSNSKISKIESDINDIVDITETKSLYILSDIIRKIESWLIKEKINSERYSEGSWWGNNTLWKTILDLNLAIHYADKKGKLRKHVQRKIITIGDMVISGEGEGPLFPSPKRINCILFADNSVLFDLILVRIMGFSEEKFVLLKEAIKCKKLFEGDIKNTYIYSNCSDWEKPIFEFSSGFKFKPTQGWKDYLG